MGNYDSVYGKELHTGNVLNTVREAARFSKKQMDSGVRHTWFEFTFSYLLYDHW